MHRFVSQRAGTRHDAHAAFQMDAAGHDADLAFARGDDARAIRTNKFGPVCAQRGFHVEHIQHRDSLGDADNDFDARIRRFQNRVRSKRCRHIDHRRAGSGHAGRVAHGIENRQSQMRLPALTRCHTADHFGAVRQRLFGMKRALLAGETLANHLGILVDQDTHTASPTARCAASVRLCAAIIESPDSANNLRPSSAFVPSSRTTTGTFTPISFTA